MKQISTALVKASTKIGGAVKDKTNPHYKSKYADLSSVIEAIKPALAENGLTFVQQFKDAEDGVCIETVIIHESGETLATGHLYVPATKKDAQGYGSAITYARRYSLQTAFGVPAEDDDGNAASKNGHAPVAATLKQEDIKVTDLSRHIASEMKRYLSTNDDYKVLELVEDLEQEEKIAIWSLLDSKERSAIKKIQQEART